MPKNDKIDNLDDLGIISEPTEQTNPSSTFIFENDEKSIGHSTHTPERGFYSVDDGGRVPASQIDKWKRTLDPTTPYTPNNITFDESKEYGDANDVEEKPAPKERAANNSQKNNDQTNSPEKTTRAGKILRRIKGDKNLEQVGIPLVAIAVGTVVTSAKGLANLMGIRKRSHLKIDNSLTSEEQVSESTESKSVSSAQENTTTPVNNTDIEYTPDTRDLLPATKKEEAPDDREYDGDTGEPIPPNKKGVSSEIEYNSDTKTSA